VVVVDVRVRLMVIIIVILFGRFDFLDHCVEPVLVVGRVLDHPGGVIGFHQTVRSLDVSMAVAHFLLALDVVRVQVLHAVLEVVWGGGRRVTAVLVLYTVTCTVVAVILVVVTLVLRRVSEGHTPEQSGDGGEHYDRLNKIINIKHFDIKQSRSVPNLDILRFGCKKNWRPLGPGEKKLLPPKSPIHG